MGELSPHAPFTRPDSLRAGVPVWGLVVPLLVLQRYRAGTAALEDLSQSRLPRAVVPPRCPVLLLLILHRARLALPSLESLHKVNFSGAVVPPLAPVVPLHCQDEQLIFWNFELVMENWNVFLVKVS
jgi:hypothetical protein